MVRARAWQDSCDCSACVRERPDYPEDLSAAALYAEVTVQRWLIHPHCPSLALCSALIQC